MREPQLFLFVTLVILDSTTKLVVEQTRELRLPHNFQRDKEREDTNRPAQRFHGNFSQIVMIVRV